jgi:hypothetical protein
MQRISIVLLQYAGFLLVCGLASVLYSAETRTAGWNPHGISGLIACGGGALIAALMGLLAGKGKGFAVWVGLALAFLFLSYGGFKFFNLIRDVSGNAAPVVTERKISQEDAERTVIYKAGVFGAAALFSLIAFLRLGTGVRNEKLT